MNYLKTIKKDDDGVIVGGYGVIFGGEDVEGETFTETTDYMLDLVPNKLVFVDHTVGFDIEIDGKSYAVKGIDEPVGRVLSVEADDVGLYMELMIERANKYWQIIEQMLDTKRTGLSTGTIGHLSRRDGKTITRWPIVETSLTLTPAEPRTTEELSRLKWVVDANPELKAVAEGVVDRDPALATFGNDDDPKIIGNNIQVLENNTMSIENERDDVPKVDVDGLVTQDEFGAFRAEIGDLTRNVQVLLDHAQNIPALKGGYIAPDSEGNDHAETKSFADFLLAVKNGNKSRLTNVYKALNEGSGTAGGYTVPVGYEAQLMKMANEAAVVRPRATVIPVATNTGTIPALDQVTAPTAGVGQSPFAGGVRAYWQAEASSITSTDPAFKEVAWDILKAGGYTKVSNELLADNAIGLEKVIQSLFGMAIAAVEDYAFLRGTGAGQPLGIFSSGAALAVTTATDNTFAIADALAMLAKFWPTAGGKPVWILHRALIADFGNFDVGAGGIDFVQPRDAVHGSLLGYPILYSEHMPNINTDDALLADLAAYLIFDRQGLQISFSEHSAFLTDESTWRFTKRLDGKPWLTGAISLGHPTTHTVSPFVYHDD